MSKLIDKEKLIEELLKLPGVGSNSNAMDVIYRFESPEVELNENQEIVLEYLKKESKNNLAPILMLSKFGWEHFGDELPKTVANAYHALNDKKDDIEILQVFATWALDQC